MKDYPYLYLATSKIHGTGLFTSQDLVKGSKLPLYHQAVGYSKEVLLGDNFPIEYLTSLEKLLWYDPTRKIYYANRTSELRFINHASRPANNIGYNLSETLSLVTLRDVVSGEELLQNYLEFFDGDPEVWETLKQGKQTEFDRFWEKISKESCQNQ